MAAEKINPEDLNEQFVFSDAARKTIFTILGIGIVLFAIGIGLLAFGGESDAAGEHALAFGGEDIVLTSGGDEAESGHHAYSWVNRLKANICVSTDQECMYKRTLCETTSFLGTKSGSWLPSQAPLCCPPPSSPSEAAKARARRGARRFGEGG